MKILIVEDEPAIRDVLKSYLVQQGWEVVISDNGIDALKKAEMLKLDLILLDLMIPGISGEEVCKRVRKKSDVPIMIISSKSREVDTIKGLDIGADDYITKPFKIKEVIARINALKRRIEMFSNKKKVVDSFNNNRLLINFESKEVYIDGTPARLTFTEFKLLNALINKPKQVLSRQELSYEVQGYRYVSDGRTMDAHIKNLRKKIEDDPSNPFYILTRIGAGYQFNCDPDEKNVI